MKQYNPLEFTNVSFPSFWRRTFAFLIDFALLFFTLFAPLNQLLMRLVPASDFATAYAAFTAETQKTAIATVALFFVFILIMLYFTLCEYLIGQTAGKRLMNLAVEDYNGNTPTFFQCLTRNLLFLLVFPFSALLVIEPLYLAWKKQRLLEQLSKTRTVNRNYINKQILSSLNTQNTQTNR